MTVFAPWPKLPAAPLIEAIDRHAALTGKSMRNMPDTLAQRYYKAKRSGQITALSADRLAVEVLRMHPAEVYGEAWYSCDPAEGHYVES